MTEDNTVKAAPKPRRKGRRSREETNKIRASLGLTVKVAPPKKDYRPPAILPEKSKAKSQEMLAAILTGTKSVTVVNKIMAKALDDDDKDQMACLKLLVDRMIPVSYFEKDKDKGNKGITIQIMGVGEVGLVQEEEAVEADYVEEEPIDG